MYIDFIASGFVNESQKQPFNEQFSTVNYTHSKSNTTRPSVVIEFLTAPTIRIPRTKTFKPVTERWPPLATEVPKEEPNNDKTQFQNAILGIVLIVALVWAAVTGIVIRNKIRAKRERRRARECPSYSELQFSSNSASSSGFPNTGINPSFQSYEISESNVIDIVSTEDDASSFVYHPSTPNQTTAENPDNVQPPSYAEIYEGNTHRFKLNNEEQPPSYVEAQLQKLKRESES